jgi:hypothetical protein
LSDRQIATGKKHPRSIWATEPGQWEGFVLFNDNHAEFKLTDKGHKGKYGNHRGEGPHKINNLFDLDADWNIARYNGDSGVGRMVSD